MNHGGTEVTEEESKMSESEVEKFFRSHESADGDYE
jgi:hypothetical protein